MPHTRRIAQGLLAVFTFTVITPPVPAWALRQGAAAQSQKTTSGLEEELTGRSSVTAVASAATPAAGLEQVTEAAARTVIQTLSPHIWVRNPLAVWAGYAEHIGHPKQLPLVTDYLVSTDAYRASYAVPNYPGMPVGGVVSENGDYLHASEISVKPPRALARTLKSLQLDVRIPRTVIDDQAMHPDIIWTLTHLPQIRSAMEKPSLGKRDYGIVEISLDHGTKLVGDRSAYVESIELNLLPAPRPKPSRKRVVLATLRQSDVAAAGLEEGLTGKPTTMTRREFLLKAAPAVALGTWAGGVAGQAAGDALTRPTVNRETFPFGTDPAPIQGSTTKAIVQTGVSLAGAAAGAAVAAWASAPADAEKVLAERLSTIVGEVRALAVGGARNPTAKLLVLVDPEVADEETVLRHSNFEKIPGYPDVMVASLSRQEYYLRNHLDRLPIAVLADTTPKRESIVPTINTIRVKGLNGQRVGDLLPVVMTEALAHWDRRDQSFDMTPYWAVRDLTADQVWQVLSSQFA